MVDTAGEGGFTGVFIAPASTVPAAGAVFAVANTVYCINMVLPFRCVVGQVASNVTTLQSGKFYGFGLYDMNKDLVVRTGAQSSTSTGVKTTSTSATVTVEPGPYWFCSSGDDTGIQLLRVNVDSFIGTSDLAQILFTAANASSAGVLPATLGTLTGSNAGILVPATYWSP